MKIYIIPILLFIYSIYLLLQENTNEDIKISYYHWTNSYKINKTDKKLYIKILDISYSKKLESNATSFITKPQNDFVPTIYITNETLKNSNYSDITSLIIRHLNKINVPFKEVQIDCDWSLSTKSNYFNLLKELKSKLHTKISATIRLHQIKYYKKTGIPPVDYGVLMYYNMSDITKVQTRNSILDNNIAKKYHYNFDKYNLKLKLALPLYSQAIQFRDNRPLDIFEGVKKEDFEDSFIKISKNIYKVKKSTYFKNRYIYKDDIFRFEDSNKKDLKTAINDFFKISKNHFNEILLYRYEYKNKYNLEELIKESL